MKKVRLIITGVLLTAIVAFSSTTQAQYADMLSASGATTETAVNTTAVYLRTISTKANTTTSIVVNVTKVSGTVAGTVVLQGSNNGTDFRTLPTAVAASFTATDVAAQGITWVLTGNPYRYYQVLYTPAGTMNATYTAQLWSH